MGTTTSKYEIDNHARITHMAHVTKQYRHFLNNNKSKTPPIGKFGVRKLATNEFLKIPIHKNSDFTQSKIDAYKNIRNIKLRH